MNAAVLEKNQSAPATLARCTLTPWVLVVRSRVFDPAYHGGNWRITGCIKVVEALSSNPPDPLDHLEDGHEFMRGEVFPAHRFDDMNGTTRQLYEGHYRAYLAWRSRKAGIEPDSENVYERAYSWCRQG